MQSTKTKISANTIAADVAVIIVKLFELKEYQLQIFSGTIVCNIGFFFVTIEIISFLAISLLYSLRGSTSKSLPKGVLLCNIGY